jgi:hypothetical protein
MRDSLRDLIKKSSADYSTENRKNWLFNWSSQIVLTLDQVFWTILVEQEGITQMKTNPSAMKDVYNKEE